jgi:hypothetical protein
MALRASIRSALIGAAMAAGSLQSQSTSAAVARTKSSTCSVRLQLVGTIPDTLDRAAVCAIATTALHFVGKGGARHLGIVPRDTIRLTRYTIVKYDLPYAPPKGLERVWLVEFALDGSRSLAVSIDRLTGHTFAAFSEPIQK